MVKITNLSLKKKALLLDGKIIIGQRETEFEFVS
jgi:hypothetical protein